MTKIEIRDAVLKELEEYIGLHVKDIAEMPGYYVFEFNEHEIFHFTFKEIPDWKFAMWITWTNDKHDEYNIAFFGNNIYWIDKFKPTASPISCEMKQKVDEEFEPFDLVWTVTNNLKGLKDHRLICEYAIGSHYWTGFITWVWSQFYYNKIYKPFFKWYERHILPVKVNIAVWLYNVRYHKYLKVRDIYDNRGKYYKQPFDINLEYNKDIDGDDRFDVYCNIEEGLIRKWLNMTNNSVGDVRIRHCEFGKNRDFYYPKNDEEDE
jgi:hypothetical protein